MIPATQRGSYVHHPIAAEWFGKETEDIVFCRVTQMGLLRLLSNPAIMGDDAIDRSHAWRTYDQLWADERQISQPNSMRSGGRSPRVMTKAISCGPMITWQSLPSRATSPVGETHRVRPAALSWCSVQPRPAVSSGQVSVVKISAARR